MRPRDGKDGSDHGVENRLEEGEGEGIETVRSKTNNGGFREIIVGARSSATLREWEGILAFMKDT